MRYLLTLMLLILPQFSFAGEVWIPESPYRPGPPSANCRPQGHYEWRSIVLRRYWKVYPCGKRELWEDVLMKKIWVEHGHGRYHILDGELD